MNGGPPMVLFYSKLTLFGRRWYYQVRGRDGKIVAKSTAHRSRASRQYAFLSLAAMVNGQYSIDDTDLAKGAEVFV